MSAAEDRADVLRVLGGDLSAFEGIVRRWEGPLVNLGYRFCRDRGRAEEMAQEAFLRAYRALGSWRQDSTFSTWLFALATNLYRSELRRLPLRTVPLEAAGEIASAGSLLAQIAGEDRDRAVRNAVLRLPAKYRETVILYYFHGMDIAASAASLGTAEGTVKARLSRARDLLRKKLPAALATTALEEA
ncbi:MAG TPA: RNA polymerase sigma factor [Candidatus Sulfotelmatobacter sp.]|nr:RNA polymerase sigma factor [Candidatus Sulfotelmatobacter sp.]